MEHYLDKRHAEAATTDGTEGVAFQVKVDGDKYDCLVLNEALFKLAELGDGNAAPDQIFRDFERTIVGTARRLVHAKVRSKPVVLRANHFRLASV